jgi:hypothetical protein
VGSASHFDAVVLVNGIERHRVAPVIYRSHQCRVSAPRSFPKLLFVVFASEKSQTLFQDRMVQTLLQVDCFEENV